MEKACHVKGVYASYIYTLDEDYIHIFRNETIREIIHKPNSNFKLYKGYAFDIDGNCLGEIQWDGTCFFMPTNGAYTLNFIMYDEDTDVSELDKIWGEL
jgi:hypothetical protein